MAALSVGTSDFLGGLAARRADSRVVTAVSNLIGFALVLVVALDRRGRCVGASDLAWGLLGGAAVSFGLVALYLGYARARVSIAAPVAGVGAAALARARDDHLRRRHARRTQATVGVILGLVSIGLVSMGRVRRAPDRSLPASSTASGGALGIGLLFLCLAETSEDSELWPIVAARLGGFLSIARGARGVTRASVVRSPRPPWQPRRRRRGLLITAGNTLFLAATREGSTAVAACGHRLCSPR